MPGPFAHLLYGLGAGGVLVHASSGRFSLRHCAVLALNGLVGPDIGSFLGWLTSVASPRFSGAVMDTVHDPFVYVAFVSPIFAVIYARLLSTRVADVMFPEVEHSRARDLGLSPSTSTLRLSPFQCFLLCAAGGLNHFYLDTIFEEDGKTPLFRRIVETGWWHDVPPLQPVHVVLVGLVTLTLFVGFFRCRALWATTNSQAEKKPPALRLLAFFAVVSAVYCGLLAWGRVWSDPPFPLVGEEADLGVVPFHLVFGLLPATLCVWSIHANTGSH